MLLRRLPFLLFLLAPLCVLGQYYMPASGPGLVERRQVVCPPFHVIYRPGEDSLARATAYYADYYASRSWLSPIRGRAYPILLHHASPVVNGLVAWAPSRMELHPLSAGEWAVPVPWLQHLISHEVRHYCQMNALDRKFVHGLWFALGEQSVALASAVTPLWFLEGDAIHNESRLAGYGRVHSAETYQSYRADLLSHRRLSYDQYISRSYRYSTPNHYGFGSVMVEYVDARYGEGVWPKVVEYTAKYPFVLFPFHFGLKRQTGHTRHQLFNQALGQMDSLYRKNVLGDFDTVSYPEQDYQRQRYPHFSPSTGNYYFWENDPANTLGLYARDSTGLARLIYEPGAVATAVRYADTLATYTELVPHPIWGRINRHRIVCINLVTQKSYTIPTSDAVVVSPIARPALGVVEYAGVTGEGRYSLVRVGINGLGNRTIGEETERATLPSGYEIRELAPGRDRNETLVRAVNQLGSMIILYNWAQHGYRILYGPKLVDISGLNTDSSAIYFSASYAYARRGFRTAWPADSAGGLTPVLLALPGYGVEDIEARGGERILYSAFTPNGYRIQEDSLHGTVQVQDLMYDNRVFPMPATDIYPRLIGQQGTMGVGQDSTSSSYRLAVHEERDTVQSIKKDYKISPYNPLLHAIRIHSWLPFYATPESSSDFLRNSDLGVTLLSQNTVGTLALSGGYFYRQTHGVGLQAVWRGIWPHVAFHGEWGGEPRLWQGLRSVRAKGTRLSGNLALQFPLRFRRGAYFYSTALSLQAQANNNRRYNPIDFTLHLAELRLGAVLSFSASRVLAARDLYTRLGFSISGGVFYQPLFGGTLGPTYRVRAAAYLPGAFPNHSLRVGTEVVWQGEAQLREIRSFNPTGLQYGAPLALRIGTGMRTYSGIYALPLGYPDLNAGSWVYLKRFTAELSVHYTKLYGVEKPRQYRLVGLALMGDMVFFRTAYQATLGVQAYYSPYGDRLSAHASDVWSVRAVVNVDLPPAGL